MIYNNVILEVKDESSIDVVRGHLIDLATASLEETGCVRFDVHQSRKDPRLFFLIEEWVDQAALDAHRDNPPLLKFTCPRSCPWSIACLIQVKEFGQRLELWSFVSFSLPQTISVHAKNATEFGTIGVFFDMRRAIHYQAGVVLSAICWPIWKTSAIGIAGSGKTCHHA